MYIVYITHTHTHIRMFIAAFFIIAKLWTPRCPSTTEWIKEWCHKKEQTTDTHE